MDVAADLVVLAVRSGDLNALLVQRADAPFAGRWALPGGFVTDDEDLCDAAGRELREETGIGPGGHLEQFGIYGAPSRDPRGRVISVAYLALVPDPPTPRPGSDAVTAVWRPVTAATDLAFDHDQILRDGLEHLRARLQYAPLATALCPIEFTINELRAIYETVWDTELDRRNFNRKALRAKGFIRPTRQQHRNELVGGRPAQLYTRGDAEILHPPLTRPRAVALALAARTVSPVERTWK